MRGQLGLLLGGTLVAGEGENRANLGGNRRRPHPEPANRMLTAVLKRQRHDEWFVIGCINLGTEADDGRVFRSDLRENCPTGFGVSIQDCSDGIVSLRMRRRGFCKSDRFTIDGGTGTITAIGMVTAETAGVVDAAKVIDSGEYTVNPGAAAATTALSGGGDDALTVDTTLSSAVVGVTEAEILDAIRNDTNVAGNVPTFVGADTFRNRRNSSDKYEAAGVPIS